jgi:hypothetical protein
MSLAEALAPAAAILIAVAWFILASSIGRAPADRGAERAGDTAGQRAASGPRQATERTPHR